MPHDWQPIRAVPPARAADKTPARGARRGSVQSDGNGSYGIMASYDDDGGILFTNANSICTGQCLTSETIVNPTAAQRADPSYYLDWVTYCTIRDSNTGASRTTMLRDFVERTVIKGLRVSWEVR